MGMNSNLSQLSWKNIMYKSKNVQHRIGKFFMVGYREGAKYMPRIESSIYVKVKRSRFQLST